MSRRFIIVNALCLVAVLGLGSWLIVVERNRTAEARTAAERARTAEALARSNDLAQRTRLLRLERVLEEQESLTRELAQAAEREHRRWESLQRELRKTHRELDRALNPAPAPTRARGPVGSDTQKLAPADATIDYLEVIPQRGARPAQIVVRWQRGGESNHPNDTGILVWMAKELFEPMRSALDADVKWRMRFEIYLPVLRSGFQRVGPPGAQHRRKPDAASLGFGLGDVTGDGYPEILAIEDTHGSGGCAIYRVLTAVDEAILEIFKRFNCEGPIEIVRGMLRIDTAIYPKGCDYAHGCGSKRTFLRWNGSSWDRVSTRITVD